MFSCSTQLPVDNSKLFCGCRAKCPTRIYYIVTSLLVMYRGRRKILINFEEIGEVFINMSKFGLKTYINRTTNRWTNIFYDFRIWWCWYILCNHQTIPQHCFRGCGSCLTETRETYNNIIIFLFFILYTTNSYVSFPTQLPVTNLYYSVGVTYGHSIIILYSSVQPEQLIRVRLHGYHGPSKISWHNNAIKYR